MGLCSSKQIDIVIPVEQSLKNIIEKSKIEISFISNEDYNKINNEQNKKIIGSRKRPPFLLY